MFQTTPEPQTLAEAKVLLGIATLEHEMAEVRARICAGPTIAPIQSLQKRFAIMREFLRAK